MASASKKTKRRQNEDKPANVFLERLAFETLEDLAADFMMVYYSVQLNSFQQKRKALEEAGRYAENQTVKLRTEHFAAMWLIELLTEKQVECVGLEVRDLLHWKHPVFDKDRFGEEILAPLVALKLIDIDTAAKQDRSTKKIKITHEGERFLTLMKSARHDAVRLLLEVFEVTPESIGKFREKLSLLSESAWKLVKDRGGVWSEGKPT